MKDIMDNITYPPPHTKLTEYPCYGVPKPITLSWTRLSDWVKCKHRVKLTLEGKRSKLSNARNFLAGRVTDLSMRKALEEAPRDDKGRLLELSKDALISQVPDIWDRAVTKAPEFDNLADGHLNKNDILKWNTMDPREDQANILNNIYTTLNNLHPILEENILGKRFIPEFRPDTMPVIGIPGPDGETCYIRLFLAVDCVVEIEESTEAGKLGEYGIYDLKTTPTVEYLEKTLPQLVFYDLAFHALTGKRPKEHALWAPLVTPPVKTVDVTDEHRRMLLSWIISYCHGVWSGADGFTDDDSNCYTCPTKTACPKVTLPITKDEQGLSVFNFGDTSGGILHG